MEEGGSQEERKAQRMNMVRLWMHNRADHVASIKVLEVEGGEDHHPLTSTETTQVGQRSQVFSQAHLFLKKKKN